MRQRPEAAAGLAGLLAIALALVLGVLGCSLFAPPSEPQAGEDQALAELRRGLLSQDGQGRERVRRALQQAARAARIELDESSFLYVSRDDLLVVHALVKGFETLRLKEPNRVGDVGLAFLALPPQAGLPPGFYKVTIRVLEAKASLWNVESRRTVTVPLERGQALPSPRPIAYVTGCRLELIYQQADPGHGLPPIQAAVVLDWCPRGR